MSPFVTARLMTSRVRNCAGHTVSSEGYGYGEPEPGLYAVVAPGIAEALFATAIGLVVAIPAVLAYNKFSSDLAKVQSAFVAGIGTLGNRLARDRSHHARSAAAE